MQVSVENTSGLGRRVTVVLPIKQLEDAVASRIKQIARTASLDGFRPGKVPEPILKKHYGPTVRQEVLEDMMRSSLNEALQHKNLMPATVPSVVLRKANPGEDIEYEATFEVYPEIEPVSLKGETIEKITATVSEQDVEKALEGLRKQYANWEKVERPAQDGDRLRIDFVGTIDDKAFAGGTVDNFELIIGAGRMIPGFEAGLIGAKPEKETIVKVTFPEDYHARELAGKPAKFTVNVHSVSEAQLPEVDEHFVARLNIKEGGVEKLRSEIRQTLERELNNVLAAKLKQQVTDKLLKLNDIEVPQGMVENEAKHLQHQAKEQMQQMRMQKMPEPALELFFEQAKRRIMLGLLFTKLAKIYHVQLDQHRVRAKAESTAAAYENPAEVVAWYYSDQNRLTELQAAVLEEQVIEALLQDVKVVDKVVTYQEAMSG